MTKLCCKIYKCKNKLQLGRENKCENLKCIQMRVLEEKLEAFGWSLIASRCDLCLYLGCLIETLFGICVGATLGTFFGYMNVYVYVTCVGDSLGSSLESLLVC